MKEKLNDLRNQLQEERQELANRLKQIDDDLASIERVLNLVSLQEISVDKRQLPLIKVRISSKRFADLTFSKALFLLFDENPEKFWAPREIAHDLLKEGFETKSKDFNATVRTMLGYMRKKQQLNATRTKVGWLYGPKEKDSAQENNAHAESLSHGDVPKRLKGPDS